MRDAIIYVKGFVELPDTPAADRRAVFRQAMAALATATGEEGPGPLDGVHGPALVEATKVALMRGFFDDVDWLRPAAAATALYAVAGALPPGNEQRELGRRVLARLLSGNAEVFVSLAALMAKTTGRGLGTSAVRARVAVAVEAPRSLGLRDGPLALTLASRREYAREWLIVPSTRSLPARRLAARLFERAAREAARRAQQGDTHAVRGLLGETLSETWDRLLSDRESLVWRHLAAARGLLSPFSDEARQQVHSAFAPNLSPTEWRRGAASAAALVAIDPGQGLRLLDEAIRTGLFKKDPGIASAFIWGIARATDAEPDAATEFLRKVLELAPLDVGEALVELKREVGQSPVVDTASELWLSQFLRSRSGTGVAGMDESTISILGDVAADLQRDPGDPTKLRDRLGLAVTAYVNEGAPAAHTIAREILEQATSEVNGLEGILLEDERAPGREGEMARRSGLEALRDLDTSLLEHNALGELLRLGTNAEQLRAHEERLDGVREKLAEWIVFREQGVNTPVSERGTVASRAPELPPSHPQLHLRRLRALLHLVDGDLGEGGDDPQRVGRQRARWAKVATALARRFDREPPTVLRRTLLATLSRALDALIRSGHIDAADGLLLLFERLTDPGAFDALSEASMDLDLRHVLGVTARYFRVLPKSTSESFDKANAPDRETLDLALRAFAELASELAPEASARSEALRTVFVRLHSALNTIALAPALSALAPEGATEPEALEQLEDWASAFVRMMHAARTRVDATYVPQAPPPSRTLSLAVSRVLAGAEPAVSQELLAQGIEEIARPLPFAFGRIVAALLWRLGELPKESSERVQTALKPQAAMVDQLPAWLPSRRILGGFYVSRALGTGGAGSVFVVHRVDERHDPNAERFALKVPDYSATAARSLSEAEFLDLFRGEASALMGLPSHDNLARFVTFDLAARPKPILVMELVEGLTLERAIETRTLDIARTFAVLDGVLSGLETMHFAGVGHLDVKPSNVVLRRETGSAVLVDFGLAGRNIRPGCATGPYGSPEVWGAVPDGATPTPGPADVYAFGCLAFEALTGQVLFSAPNEVAQVAMHLMHDGRPPAVEALGKDEALRPIAELLFHALRRDPRARVDVSILRRELSKAGARLAGRPWPLAA